MNDFKDEYKDDLLKAVLKRALGYSSTETQEERNANMEVTKQKTVTKEVPPSLSAVKLLMEKLSVDPYDKLSDEELESEKLRLLKMLK